MIIGVGLLVGHSTRLEGIAFKRRSFDVPSQHVSAIPGVYETIKNGEKGK